MITTFFGAHSFGGDAVYVERLARALLRRGHEVDVIHCEDSFNAVRGKTPLRVYEPPAGLNVRPLRSRLGKLSPAITHQLGRPGTKLNAIREALDGGVFDVVHFHNISLIGGPGVLLLPARGAVKLMTAHEHWLTCPLSLLWKFDREVCERPQCVRCSLAAGRPPQPWRYTGLLDRALRSLDALIVPSRHAAETHQARGIDSPLVLLPYFLPDDWAGSPPGREFAAGRPYVAAAGRLVKEKGFHWLIPLMARLPDVDLLIAGAGPMEDKLRELARGLRNVRFLGLLGFADLAELFRNARALVVPSLFYETFGYVVLESFSVGTPAIVHRRGSLPELIEVSGGGITYETDDELVAAIRRVVDDVATRRELGERGAKAVRDVWSEERILTQYFNVIDKKKVEWRV